MCGCKGKHKLKKQGHKQGKNMTKVGKKTKMMITHELLQNTRKGVKKNVKKLRNA